MTFRLLYTPNQTDSLLQQSDTAANVQGALQYFKIFARTIQREWFGIDKLRLDKFMVLARKFLHQVYTHLQNTGWCASEPPFCWWHLPITKLFRFYLHEHFYSYRDY